MMRWRFEDDITGDLFTMYRNPRMMDSLVRQSISSVDRGPRGVMRVTRNPAGAFPWTFSGRVHTEAEQDTLRNWAGRERIVIRDHLNREHLVIPQGIVPTPVAAQSNGTRNPWLYEYVFQTIYLRRQS